MFYKINNMKTRDAPDILPDNLTLFYIHYPAGYRISLAGYPAGYGILKIAEYPAN
jgi:hypothetical protein